VQFLQGTFFIVERNDHADVHAARVLRLRLPGLRQPGLLLPGLLLPGLLLPGLLLPGLLLPTIVVRRMRLLLCVGSRSWLRLFGLFRVLVGHRWLLFGMEHTKLTNFP